MKPLVLWGLLFLISYALAERLSLYFEAYLEKYSGLEYHYVYLDRHPPRLEQKLRALIDHATDNYYRLDPKLGWSIAPNRTKGDYRSNAAGIRASREYALEPSHGVIRIATFGDSFTHGDDVANDETWQEQLANRVPGIEVLNFGVGGYGTDQAYLRYRSDGVAYRPHIAVLGLIPENVGRNVNYYVPFYRRLSWPMSKPRFALHDEEGLLLHDNLLRGIADYRVLLDQPEQVLPRLAQHEYWMRYRNVAGWMDASPTLRLFKHFLSRRPKEFLTGDGPAGRVFDPDSEPLLVTRRILRAFVDDAVRNGSIPLIFIFPDFGDVERYRKHHTKIYSSLLEVLSRDGIEHVDLMRAFDRYAHHDGMGRLFRGHYTSYGNGLIARYLADTLPSGVLARVPLKQRSTR